MDSDIREVIASGGLNLRYTPQILPKKANVIRVLGYGERVRLGGVHSADAPNVWQIIVNEDHSFAGWCAGEYLREIKDDPIRTGNRIGLHLHQGGNKGYVIDMAKRLKAAGHPLGCAVVISDPDFANALAPYTTVVHRQVWRADDPPPTIPNDEAAAIAAGERWLDKFLTSISAAKDAHYHQFTNEIGFHPYDYAFNLGVMYRAEALGIKAAIFGDSLGTPEISEWQQREKALRYAAAHGHVVCLHEYSPWVNNQPSGLPVSGADQAEFYGQRHKALYASVPSDCRPMLIIAECGASNAIFPGAAALVSDMKAYNAILIMDGYVIACAWWTVGGGEKFSYSSYDRALPEIETLLMTL